MTESEHNVALQPSPRTDSVQWLPLQKVEIQNFRSLRDVVIQLDPTVTVLFGANAAGKTSVLNALAIALGSLVSRVPKASGRNFAKSGDLRRPWRDREDVKERRGVERPFMRVAITASEGVHWDVSRLRSVQDRSELKSWGIKALHDAIDPVIKAILDTPPDLPSVPLPLVAAYGTERALVEVPLRERYFQRDFDRLGAFDRSLEASTRFKTVFEWFRVMEDEERREGKKRRDLDYKLPALQWIRRAVERAAPRCHNPRVETHPIRMLVDFDHGDGQLEPLNVDALSDGYRTHFSLVADIARRMVQLNPSDDLTDLRRGTNSEAVILIDEIDLHLDPVWQATVVTGLTSAFPNTQFILTTHSEQVIGSVKAESVRKLVWGDGEVQVEQVPFAQGATGERILVDLMGAYERVPGEITTKLKQYQNLVETGASTTEAGEALRAELDQALPNDPSLHHADLEVQRQSLMAKLKGLES